MSYFSLAVKNGNIGYCDKFSKDEHKNYTRYPNNSRLEVFRDTIKRPILIEYIAVPLRKKVYNENAGFFSRNLITPICHNSVILSHSWYLE